MIRVDIKRKAYGGQAILGPVAFEIRPGETVALVGPSGVGKSTLLGILAGIDTRFDGAVTRPDAVAVVFQEPTLLPWRSVLDNVLLVHPGLGRDAGKSALAATGLQGKDNMFPGQLSLGQQRRLALARAFAGKPELLLMDEPFVSLDSETAEAMVSLTETLIAEHRPATLFVTHAMSEAERLATRVLTLEFHPDGARLRSVP